MEFNHKCDGCRYRGEHHEMGFRPFGVCTKETNLIEAEKAYKAEVCPFEGKQFNEMRYLADEMGKAISTEYEKRYLADERKLEAVLKANGWCKASDVAREIFEEIEKMLLDNHIGHYKTTIDTWCYNFNNEIISEIAELKKKYTEGGK